MMFVFLWLTSVSMIISRSVRVAANDIFSFYLWLSNIPLCIYTYFFFVVVVLRVLVKKNRKTFREFPLWCSKFNSISGALGCRFDPLMAQWVKDPVLPQLLYRSQLWLGSLAQELHVPKGDQEKKLSVGTCMLSAPHIHVHLCQHPVSKRTPSFWMWQEKVPPYRFGL